MSRAAIWLTASLFACDRSQAYNSKAIQVGNIPNGVVNEPVEFESEYILYVNHVMFDSMVVKYIYDELVQNCYGIVYCITKKFK